MFCKTDHDESIIAIVLNSTQPFYCQIILVSNHTHQGIYKKTMKAIHPNDCPPHEEKVKMNLCVSDIEWSADNSFIFVLFESNCVSMLTRAGQWVKILNPMNPLLTKKILTPKIFNKLPKITEKTQSKFGKIDVLQLLRQAFH